MGLTNKVMDDKKFGDDERNDEAYGHQPKPLSHEEIRRQQHEKALAEANAMLLRPDTPLVALEKAITTKLAIETARAMQQQAREEQKAEAQRKKDEEAERRRVLGERLLNEPELRAEMVRRDVEDARRKSYNLPPINHGPLPPPKLEETPQADGQ